MRVLLVDDDDGIRRMLRRILEREGSFEVVGEASSGLKAVGLVNDLRPDVVVMDVEMPGIDGVTATTHIKRTCPNIQVIAFTSADDKATRTAMLEAGAAAFLTKRQSREEIVAALHDVGRSLDDPAGG